MSILDCCFSCFFPWYCGNVEFLTRVFGNLSVLLFGQACWQKKLCNDNLRVTKSICNQKLTCKLILDFGFHCKHETQTMHLGRLSSQTHRPMPTVFSLLFLHSQGNTMPWLCISFCSMLLLPTHITNSPPSPPTPPPKTRLGILFLWAFTSPAMIWQKEPLHRVSSCTDVVHTLFVPSSVSRGLVNGHFHKLKNKQSLGWT